MSCLIVEDETYFAQLLKLAMQKEFSAVDIAFNGEQALGLVKRTRYDVILLDLTLPKIDGISVLRRMRSERVTSHILVVSGRDAVAQRIDGLEAGADDYICKPFHMQELHARVEALRRRPVARLCVADLVLDLVNFTVSRGGKQVQLCKKEFAILELLMRNSGFPVTRAVLVDRLWDESGADSNSILDVHVNKLRQKVDQGFEQKLIHTLRGTGYLMECRMVTKE